MPRLPDKSALGGLPSLQTGDSVVTGSQYGAGEVARGLEKAGGALTQVADDEIHKRDALDAAKWEAARRPQYEALVDEFHKDPDYKTFGPRFKEAVSEIDKNAEGLVTSPELREKLRYKAAVESDGALRRVLSHGDRLRRQDEYAQADDAIGRTVSPAINPDTTPESASETVRQAQAHLDNLRNTGVLDPAQAHHLQDRHITGINGVLPRIAANRLWSDPYGTLTDLGVANSAQPSAPGSSIGPRRSDGLATVTTGGGAKVHVSADHADRFKGLLDDLEANGVEIKADQTGGYNTRPIRGTGTPSQHSFGRAIDINWNENAEGTKGKLDPELARSLAAKWGLKWGGDWKNPDPMHFEVAKDAKPVPMEQRGITSFAGNKKPTEQDQAAEPADPNDRTPPLPTTGSPWADLYSRMSPVARAHLITNARTALHATLQQDLKDAEAYAERNGELPVDDNGKTVKDRMARILTPNQISKGNLALDSAVGRFKAVSGLSDMDDAQAEQHLRTISPDEKVKEGLPYAIAAKNQQYAQKAYQKIQDLRAKDPAQAVMGGPLSVAGVPKVSVGADGQLAIDEGDTGNVRTRAAPEVQQTMAILRGQHPDLQLTQAEDGTVSVNPSADPAGRTKAIGSILDARLAAQKRLGVPGSDQRAITMKEAQGLLDMRNASSLSADEFQTKIAEAQKRAKEAYGPYAGRALSDAVKLVVKDRQNKETGLDLATSLITGRIDPDSLLQQRATRAFDDRYWKSGPGTLPSGESGQRGSEMLRRSAADQPTEFEPWRSAPGVGPARRAPSVEQGSMGSDVASPGIAISTYPTPSSAQIEWLKKNSGNPTALTVFRSKFGTDAVKRYGGASEQK